MSEWIRTLLGFLTIFVYACLIGFKALDLSKLEKSSDENTQVSETQIRKRRQTLRFDMIRLALDCILLTGFCVSDLFPAWFRLFHETTLGYYTGCMELICDTLLISVFVDWIPIYRKCRLEGSKIPSFVRYLMNQFVNLIKIEFALWLIWIVLLFLEPTKINLPVKIAVAAGILLLLRISLRVIQIVKRKAEKAE